MSQPTNTFSTYSNVGIREDLSDAIYMISPTSTPFLSGIAKTKASNSYHEWQIDSLAAASGSNFVIEGDDATTDAGTATTRRGNYLAISDKVAQVTGTNEAVTKAGRKSEMGRQMMKRSAELKRDVETILLQNTARVAGNDSTARKCAGIETWIKTNDVFGASGASPTGDGTDTRTDGTQRVFLESYLQSVLALCADAGGEPDTIMVGSFNKQMMSGFSGNATRTVNAADKTLVNAIDVYKGDFGDLKVVYNRFQRSRSALVLQMDMWAFATLRDFNSWDLAKTGDTDRKQILVEYTLESRNEAASGGVFDLTTS